MKNCFVLIVKEFVLPYKVLFTESLSPSQFPVFTMYATKICLKNVRKECSFPQHQLTTRIKKRKQNSILPREVRSDGSTTKTYLKRSWSFDRVHYHQLVGFVRKRIRVRNERQECMELCLTEVKFICR